MSDAGKEWEAFYTTSVLGLVMMVVGCLQDRKLEQGDDEVNEMSKCERAEFIFKEIREAFRTKELFRTWIFFIIMGLIPQFKEYMYFY